MRRTIPVVIAAMLVGVPAGANGPRIVLTKEQAKDLFGGMKAKMVMTYGGGLHPNQPQYGIELTADKPEWFFICNDGNSARFSSDGERIAYSAAGNRVHVRKFAKDGPGLQLIGNGVKPTWWTHPETGDEYIIWGSRWGNDNNIGGKTFIRKMKKGTCEPAGEIKVLVPNYNLGDGRSPDGKWICGTQPGCALAKFKDPNAVENAAVEIVWSQSRCCNGAIAPTPKLSGIFHYEDVLHNRISFSPQGGEGGKVMPDIQPPPPHRHMMWVHWANDADYITAAPSGPDDYMRPPIHDGYIYQMSKKRWVIYSKGAGMSDLWVGLEWHAGKPTGSVKVKHFASLMPTLSVDKPYKPLLDKFEKYAAEGKTAEKVAEARAIVEAVKAWGEKGLSTAKDSESGDLKESVKIYKMLAARFAGMATGDAAKARLADEGFRLEVKAWTGYEKLLGYEKKLKPVQGAEANAQDRKWVAVNYVAISRMKEIARALKGKYKDTRAAQQAAVVLDKYGIK